jgi:hypothetical protein
MGGLIHFMKYDFVPWFIVGSFGVPAVLMGIMTAVFLWSIGVYQDLIE